MTALSLHNGCTLRNRSTATVSPPGGTVFRFYTLYSYIHNITYIPGGEGALCNVATGINTVCTWDAVLPLITKFRCFVFGGNSNTKWVFIPMGFVRLTIFKQFRICYNATIRFGTCWCWSRCKYKISHLTTNMPWLILHG